MANNVEATAGSGTTFKTTDNAGVHTGHVNVDSLPVSQGAGAVDSTTQRVVIATDSPGVTALGQAAKASSLPVTIASDQSHAYSASATFTPAAASHTAGDVNGGAQEFTSMGPSAGRIMITSASLEIDGGTAEATAWVLYLYNITPPSATADDGAWDLASGDRASFLGEIQIGTAIDKGSTQWVEVHGINKQIKLAGTSIFAYLVNATTLTPANVAHIVTLHTQAV